MPSPAEGTEGAAPGGSESRCDEEATSIAGGEVGSVSDKGCASPDAAEAAPAFVVDAGASAAAAEPEPGVAGSVCTCSDSG